MKTLSDRLESFADLEKNWNSYNAGPIDRRAIDASKAFVEHLNACPTVNGGVQLEGRLGDHYLEIEIAEDGTVKSFCIDKER